jgi:predicted HAD superfamily Cof-like phosphohydrolase
MSEFDQYDFVDMVYDFNEQVIGIGDVELNPLDRSTAEWTVKAYTEEIDEFKEGFDEQDIVKMVDANLDLIYFALGTLKKLGLSRDQVRQCMASVHAANMTKVKAKLAKRGNHENDAAKPEGFVPPEEAISDILFME